MMVLNAARSLATGVFLASAIWANAFSVSLNPSNPRCGLSNGEVNAYATGGTAPYTYLWSNGETTQAIDGLAPGTYSVTVTDAVSATETSSTTLVNVQALAQPSSYETGGTDCFGPACEAHAHIFLDYLGGTPPYTFDPPPDIQTAAFADWTLCGMLGPGDWDDPFTMIDANGCAGSGSFWLYMPGGVGVGIPAVTTLPSCNGGANGTAVLHYQFVDAQSAYITVLNSSNTVVFSAGLPPGLLPSSITVPNLLPDDYTVNYVVDMYDCPAMNYSDSPFTIADMSGDCGTVSGDLYVDEDDDCSQDAAEAAIPYALLSIQPGDELTFTNETGQYYHNLAYGDFTIEHADASFQQLCPVTSPVPFTIDGANLNVNIDLADSSLTGHDISVHSIGNAARPGFTHTVWINLWNNSLYTSGDLVLSYSFDPVLQFLSASLPPDLSTPGSLQWNLDPLAPHGHAGLSVQFQVPPDAGLLGQVLNSLAAVTNTEPEADLVNNSYPGSVTVTGSFDPNDKSVRTSSGASDGQYFIGLDEWVDYTIRFQNTGTDTAFTVLIRDTIAVELDLLTTEILGASHPMDVDVRNQRVLTFTFNDILLPDSNTNEAMSHGAVSFRIRPVGGLAAGTPLVNEADIYFDFNEPVTTNTVGLVMDLSTAIADKDEDALVLWPNPNEDALHVSVGDGGHRLFQLDVLALDGRVVLRDGAFLLSDALDTRPLPSGAYLLRLQDTDGRVLQAPFVKRSSARDERPDPLVEHRASIVASVPIAMRSERSGHL